jgi:hypothetical protein
MRAIRDDGDYWTEVETYVRSQARVEFSQGICPRWMVERFPDQARAIIDEALGLEDDEAKTGSG